VFLLTPTGETLQSNYIRYVFQIQAPHNAYRQDLLKLTRCGGANVFGVIDFPLRDYFKRHQVKYMFGVVCLFKKQLKTLLFERAFSL